MTHILDQSNEPDDSSIGLLDLPVEILLKIVDYTANDATSLIKLSQCNKWLYASLCCADGMSDTLWKTAVDKIWKKAANAFCGLSLVNGPYGPRIGTGGLYVWFSSLAVWGDRNPVVMRLSNCELQLLKKQMEMGGPIKDTAQTGNETPENQLGDIL